MHRYNSRANADRDTMFWTSYRHLVDVKHRRCRSLRRLIYGNYFSRRLLCVPVLYTQFCIIQFILRYMTTQHNIHRVARTWIYMYKQYVRTGNRCQLVEQLTTGAPRVGYTRWCLLTRSVLILKGSNDVVCYMHTWLSRFMKLKRWSWCSEVLIVWKHIRLSCWAIRSEAWVWAQQRFWWW